MVFLPGSVVFQQDERTDSEVRVGIDPELPSIFYAPVSERDVT
jgi:hypothetical protein